MNFRKLKLCVDSLDRHLLRQSSFAACDDYTKTTSTKLTIREFIGAQQRHKRYFGQPEPQITASAAWMLFLCGRHGCGVLKGRTDVW
jgi:hypothetical protein